jgi:hypothetical protein
MKALIFSLLTVCSALILTSGCSDDPTDVGAGVLPSQDTVTTRTLVFYAASDTTFRKRIDGIYGRLLAGKYRDLVTPQDIEARTLLEFSGVPIFKSGVIIDSAFITLTVDYRFGDTTGQYGFTAYKRAPSWSEDPKAFNWDSVSQLPADPVGTFLAPSIAPTDTFIRFALDTALIRAWSKTTGGLGSVLLVPSLTTGFVLGFGDVVTTISDNRPQLTVMYHDSADTAITFSQRVSRSMFVADATPPPQPGDRMTLQSGVVYRSRLLFDSLSIPLDTLTIPAKASITKATLEVTVDQAHSFFNSLTRDSMIVYILKGSTYPFDSVSLGTVLSPVNQAPQKLYRADVKNIVQQWVGKQPNYGFALRAFNELTSLDRFSVNGIQGIPVEFQPKLTVTYTLFP